MEYKSNITSGQVEYFISGKIEFSDRIKKDEIVKDMEANQSKKIILNLNGVEFIDSSGFGFLLIMKEAVEKNKSHIVIVKPQTGVSKMLKACKFDEVFEIEF